MADALLFAARLGSRGKERIDEQRFRFAVIAIVIAVSLTGAARALAARRPPAVDAAATGERSHAPPV